MNTRYKPILPLASGGMADVWLGVQLSDTGFAKLCAIKTIKKQSRDNDNFISMFRDEASICQSLQHANIVQVLDFTSLDNGIALVMEFIQGVNLGHLLEKFRDSEQAVPSPIVAYIGREIANGLNYVHMRRDPLSDRPLGIVHRDISPSNILLSTDGEVKITDFGIAKARDNTTETQVGVIKGKFQYMSPEQFSGRGIDHRTDVYALGCILWEALAGRRMYQAESEAHLLSMIANPTPRPDLLDLQPYVDAQLAQIVGRCIELDIDKRMPSALQLAKELGDVLVRISSRISAEDIKSFINDYAHEALLESRSLARNALSTVSQQGTAENNWKVEDSESKKLRVIIDAPELAISSETSFNGKHSNSSRGQTNLAWGYTSNTGISAHTKRRLPRQHKSAGVLQGIVVFVGTLALALGAVAATAQYGLRIDVRAKTLEFKKQLVETLMK